MTPILASMLSMGKTVMTAMPRITGGTTTQDEEPHFRGEPELDDTFFDQFDTSVVSHRLDHLNFFDDDSTVGNTTRFNRWLSHSSDSASDQDPWNDLGADSGGEIKMSFEDDFHLTVIPNFHHDSDAYISKLEHRLERLQLVNQNPNTKEIVAAITRARALRMQFETPEANEFEIPKNWFNDHHSAVIGEVHHSTGNTPDDTANNARGATNRSALSLSANINAIQEASTVTSFAPTRRSNDAFYHFAFIRTSLTSTQESAKAETLTDCNSGLGNAEYIRWNSTLITTPCDLNPFASACSIDVPDKQHTSFVAECKVLAEGKGLSKFVHKCHRG
ncbi:hypothetical protein HPB51_014973 [Rhipicephalus microplus]|uniref:Uncharacterized protein n=1 Tax=Rhipicephalus microplus TaxID=6941 RepID=A0A9J6E2E4_RHIMP|nr:hypothetical protein HPB51_014973 [Rhipicephalus microplus]